MNERFIPISEVGSGRYIVPAEVSDSLLKGRMVSIYKLAREVAKEMREKEKAKK